MLPQYRRNASTSSTIAAIPPMADPTAIAAMALVLRLVVAFVVEAEVEVGVCVKDDVGAKTVLEVKVAMVEVELFELSEIVLVEPPLGLDFEAVVGDCVDKVLVGGTELLEKEVLALKSTINPGEGIFDAPR